MVDLDWVETEGDKAFYKTFADAPTNNPDRAKVIQEVLHRQVASLERVTGQQEPLMRTVIYDETSEYMAVGLLPCCRT